MRVRALPYAYLAPALLVLMATGALPLGFVFFASVHDIFGPNDFLFVELQWFGVVLGSDEFQSAFLRSLGFSALALAVQLPLGVWIAHRLPARGRLAAALLVAIALPLLLPPIVVGYLWKAMTLPGTGLLTATLSLAGIDLELGGGKVASWAVLLLMDIWHWTSLVVLLTYAGLRAIPDAYYRAARIDGASPWAVFRYIELPRLRMVLGIAAVLRFMDSFMIYAEAYVVTRGGPGVATSFMSHALVQTSTIEFDLGRGGAMAVITFLIVVAVSLAFFRTVMADPVKDKAAER